MHALKAAILLLTTTFFWGITFTIVKQAIETVDVFVFLSQRFILAFVCIIPICFYKGNRFDLTTLKQGTIMGLFLFGAYGFQTMALQYTTASNTGFLTGLNVVMVPVISALLLKQPVPAAIKSAVFLAAIGLFLLCSNGSMAVNSGDLLAGICAICVSLHLIYTGEYAQHSDYFWLTAVQLGMVALLSSVTALATGKQIFMWYPHLLSTLLICALIATVFAFLVQTSMQRFISPTNTALIFCTEPVFAALYAWLMLDERLGIAGFIGALLILAGMVISILPAGITPQKPHGGIQDAVVLDEYRVGE